MDKIQKAILISIISIAALSWVLSKDQFDMMKAMMTNDPIALSLFTASWTVGMARNDVSSDNANGFALQ